jgi:hypothetical protein
MKTLTTTSLLALASLLGSVAQAQTAGTIAFSVNKTSATGSLAPVVTWSTSPVASSCTASGGWSGTKFASGSETLATITASKTYTITCAWGNGTATVNWRIPTTNSDGTPLTNLASFKVLYGTDAGSYSYSKLVNDPRATSSTIGSLGAGHWYFVAHAVNTQGVESTDSNVGSKNIVAATAAKSVNVTITAPSSPPPPTGVVRKTVAVPVYDVVRTAYWSRGAQVGTIAVGKVCNNDFSVKGNYFSVNRSDAKLTGTPRSTQVVAMCKPTT